MIFSSDGHREDLGIGAGRGSNGGNRDSGVEDDADPFDKSAAVLPKTAWRR